MPAEVILDPDCLCRPYEPAMREQFLKMNPHHISCLYKPVFAENAVKQLLSYDDSLGGLLAFHVPEDHSTDCSDGIINGPSQGEAQDADSCSRTEDMVNGFSKLFQKDNPTNKLTKNQHQMTFMEGLRLDKPRQGKVSYI